MRSHKWAINDSPSPLYNAALMLYLAHQWESASTQEIQSTKTEILELELHFKPVAPICRLRDMMSVLCLDFSTSHGVEGGCSSVLHCWADLWPLLLHQWGETTQWGALLPRQPVLPLPRHPTGTSHVFYKHVYTHANTHCSKPHVDLFVVACLHNKSNLLVCPF